MLKKGIISSVPALLLEGQRQTFRTAFTQGTVRGSSRDKTPGNSHVLPRICQLNRILSGYSYVVTILYVYIYIHQLKKMLE